jgi:chemotaxis methyl-accepting protein methylase
MTKLIETATKQLVDVVSRENDDTQAKIRAQIAERSQHVDFIEQWFGYVEQQIEADRRAAIEQVNASITEGFRKITEQLQQMKDAVMPGAVKAVSDLNDALNRFKE